MGQRRLDEDPGDGQRGGQGGTGGRLRASRREPLEERELERLVGGGSAARE
ncbi:hypothetical protein [Arthrobacter sp. ISL-72]|uniref:hypothetical protein n=1 Tax=Arthrobacter sp. ISL-72 TaxID=2819114 RepID=UPI002034DADD|nr:hypothetical protein [Arthrobacter sp. ISL-72]